MTFSKIADNTTPAPGSGTIFSSFRHATINGNTVAFTAYPGGSGYYNVYTGTVGLIGASLIAQSGTSAGADGTISSIYGPVPAISGSNIVFVGNTTIGGKGLYAGTVGSTGASPVANALTPWPANPSRGLGVGFQGGPCVSGTTAVFSISSSSSSYPNGIFTATLGSPGVSVIADASTPVPGQAVNFSPGFGGAAGSPSISGSNVAFVGGWSGGSGVYTGTAGVTGASLLVDTTTQAPGSAGNFTFFGIAVISGTNVAYSAQFDGGNGVYMSTFGTAGARRLVDSTMLMPGTTTHFGGFYNVAIGGSDVAFYERDSSGSGIFLSDDGFVSQVVRTGDPLFGSTVTSVHLGQDGYDDTTKQIVFDYVLASGEQGVATAYVGAIPEPAMLSISLIIPLLLRRRKRVRVGFLNGKGN